MAKWKDVVVSPETSLSEAIRKIDASGLQVALIVGHDDVLKGILTDGDIRRAVLMGRNLEIPVSQVMKTKPITFSPTASRDEMLKLMQKRSIRHLPLVDEASRLVDLITMNDLMGSSDHANWVILMAGGAGERLQPLTNGCPKPLLKLGDKPILENILESFAGQGFKRIFLSVNYKAEMIRDHFGTGGPWGVQVDYLQEDMKLGTAGGLSLLPEKPKEPIVVMNGDLLTRANYGNLLEFHNKHGAVATMAVREYDFQVPYGVVRLNGVHIKGIDEKLVQKFYINAGIYVLFEGILD
jgi:GTP:adenosylcobinamide-phosphate guanylyltransferase